MVRRGPVGLGHIATFVPSDPLLSRPLSLHQIPSIAGYHSGRGLSLLSPDWIRARIRSSKGDFAGGDQLGLPRSTEVVQDATLMPLLAGPWIMENSHKVSKKTAFLVLRKSTVQCVLHAMDSFVEAEGVVFLPEKHIGATTQEVLFRWREDCRALAAAGS